MIYCFATIGDLVDKLCSDFRQYVADRLGETDKIHIALSGGNTPKAFLAALALDHNTKGKIVAWNNIHFYWSDERCVPADHKDSNFQMANYALLSNIKISNRNIHRIRGENEPFYEAKRYSGEISEHVPYIESFPVFDLVFLGVGEDGHCGSIFPDRTELIHSDNVCEAVKHPVSGQLRITLTGQPLIKSKRIIFIVTGGSKSTVIRQIFNNENSAATYPASIVNSLSTNAYWYLDDDAAKFINTSCRDKY